MKKLTKKFLAFAYNVTALCKGSFAHKHEVGRGNKKENFRAQDFKDTSKISYYTSGRDKTVIQSKHSQLKSRLTTSSTVLVRFAPVLFGR